MAYNSIRSSLLLGAAAIGAAAATPAWAQASPEGAAGTDGDIIVTARRTEERLQDVPISITVFNQQAISNRNIAVATDLATYTPSLSVNQRFGPEKASFAIRGFNQDSATAPSVGVYFADVVGVRAQAGTTSGNTVGAGAFMDLQNVQVLKGPQGTLFGRNTTGGAVLLVPNKPTDRWEGWVEGQLGSYDLRRVQAVANAPLSDTIRLRAAVDRNTRDGFMKNMSDIGPKSLNDLNYFAARVSLVADITPDLENYTIFQYSNSFSRGYASRVVGCNPVLGPGATISGPAGCAQVRRQSARGDGLLDADVNVVDPKIGIKQWQVINTTTWKASDNLTIKNIASYGEFRERSIWQLYSDNLFIVPNPAVPATIAAAGQRVRFTTLYPAPTGDTSNGRSYTEELQFQGTAFDERLNWQVGGYLEFSRPGKFSDSYVGSVVLCADEQAAQTLKCANPLGSGGMTYASTKYEFDNHGVYGQATYKITDQLSLTGGFRYTFDKIHAEGESTRFTAINTPNQRQICQDVLRFYEKDAAGNPVLVNGRRVPLGTLTPLSSKGQCHNEIDSSSSKPTWLIDVDFKPTPDTLIYAKYSRGYRQGGINLGNIGIETWQPEKIDAYEIGAKASFRGSISGYFNVAAFYNDFSNQQIFASAGTKDITIISGASAIVNAGKSKIQGIEVDGSATLFKGLRLDLGYTYLDAKLKSITLPTLPAESPFSVLSSSAKPGSPLTFSPKHRLTVTATYSVPMAESAGQIDIGATYTYTSKSITNADVPEYVLYNTGCPTLNCQPISAANPAVGKNAPGAIPFGVSPAVGLLNFNVNWNRVMDSNIDLAFFMTNVTNKLYPVANGGGYSSAGFGDILMAPPRMWGFRMRVNFGK